MKAVEPATNIGGSPYPLVQLDVGHVAGGQDFEQSIYVEPEHLVRVR